MKPSETLITPQEVVRFDQSTDHSHATQRCAFIIDVEEELFNKCWRWEFYQALLNDKIKYVEQGSLAQNGETIYEHYDRATPYAVDKVVLHQGHFYKVLQVTDGSQSISDKRYFDPMPKFRSQHYEFIWRRYLGRLIAFSVTNTSVMYRLLKDTAKGLIKQYDEGSSRPATLKEAMAIKQEAQIDVERIKANMEAYIKRNKMAFTNYKLEEDNCGSCASVSLTKNLGFNV